MTATHALGWALVHFLWQGAALAVLLAIVLAATRPTAARARYALSLLTLGAMLVLPVATGLRLLQRASDSAPPPSIQSQPTVPSEATATSRQSPAPLQSTDPIMTPATTVAPAGRSVAQLLEPALPWLVVIWAIGVLALSLRLANGWLMTRRLRTEGTRETSPGLQEILARLAARLRVSRPVRLLESLVVEVPAVIGWLRPVILVPTSALTGLTPQQLAVLLAHELAHVRRYDYVVNVAQCVIETLLFYHPAVWWVSRRVRDEREHCCDDLVVQVCGDPHLYASALVDMERIRATTPRLALAANGGSLLHRVKRLIVPAAVRTEYFPRWAAGIAGVLAVTLALLATGSDRVAGAPAAALTADTTRMTPDTVLRHPDQSQPLAQRWEWARTEAQRLGRRAYWVGYTVTRPVWLEHSVYVDHGMQVTGQNITLSGRLIGDFQGFAFRGVRLPPLTGTGDSDDIVLLFEFTRDAGGKAALSHVHVASVYLPMDFRGRTLVWLGKATDAQSLPIVEALFAATSQPKLREDVVSAIGVHGSSDLVVPILIRVLTGRDTPDVRSQAAEWLGFQPAPSAVVALSAAARGDGSADVRREAAEALGDNKLPAATDSAIAVAKTAGDSDTRREAVEGLGQKDGDRALAALIAIAQFDRDEDVQREAVEALGQMSNGRGLNAVREVAHNHRSPDVRREAVETLGENLEPAAAVTFLQEVATTDPSADVRREAVETLGEQAPTAETVHFLTQLAINAQEDVARSAVETLGEIGELGLPAVIEIARTHPNADLRRRAVETIGDKAPPAQALDVLAQIVRRDDNSDVQRGAVEAIGGVDDARAYRLLVDLARTHPVSDVRRGAVEALGEIKGGASDSVITVLGEIARSDHDEDVAHGAVETLGGLHDARALAIVARIAKGTGSDDVRRAAIETYTESASRDSALVLLKGILASEATEDVYAKVLESLADMDEGAGIPTLIQAARSHPNREVRAEAIRRLADSDDPRAQKLFDQTLRRP